MAIYVVTDGEYSDYHICSMFSTRELADEYITKRGSGEIEEHVVDEDIDLVAGIKFSSTIELLTGRVEHISLERRILHRPNERVPEHEHVPEVHRYEGEAAVYAKYHRTSYVSQEHADKLAVELRQDLLRRWGGVSNLRAGRNDCWLRLVQDVAEVAS